MSFQIDPSLECQFKLPLNSDPSYSCPYSAISPREKFCVFHTSKKQDVVFTGPGVEDHSLIREVNAEFISRMGEVFSRAEDNEVDFIDFRGFHFPKIEFDSIPFQKKANFSYATFNEDVDFSIKVENDVSEDNDEDTGLFLLKKGAIFKETVFSGNAKFSGCEIDHDVDFTGALFEKVASFEAVRFNVFSQFYDVIFQGQAEFQMAYLYGGNFTNAIFSEDVNFWNFHIGTNAPFLDAVFKKQVEFYRCSFGLDYEDDEENTENNYVDSSDFHGVSFNGKVIFIDVDFYQGVSFSNAIFMKQTEFLSEKTWLFHKNVYFIRLSCPEMNLLYSME
jgi:uncharacterized protein YjbI with pentapeptide repeats